MRRSQPRFLMSLITVLPGRYEYHVHSVFPRRSVSRMQEHNRNDANAHASSTNRCASRIHAARIEVESERTNCCKSARFTGFALIVHVTNEGSWVDVPDTLLLIPWQEVGPAPQRRVAGIGVARMSVEVASAESRRSVNYPIRECRVFTRDS